MKLEIIRIPSFWGTELRQKHISAQEEKQQISRALPGKKLSLRTSIALLWR